MPEAGAAPCAARPRLLVIAIGNASRGDDALGPLLLERLRGRASGSADASDKNDATDATHATDATDATDATASTVADVEWLAEFQLQVEHALDLVGRDAVLFVDAARPGQVDGCALERIAADAAAPLWSHALRPQAVLQVFTRIEGRAPPPAWLLAIEGESFELGAPLSAAARAHLDAAEALARDWLARHGRPR
jgi:hydrogenase maturation protease